MNILKPALFLVLTCLLKISLFAQNNNLQSKKTYFENCIPFTEISDDIYRQITKKADKNVISINRKASYTIPVVFHIVHKNGVENISDEQIYSALDILNEDFSMTNPDLVNVPEAFVDLIANANINFKLAKQAPDGNCSNGINRYFSGYEIDSLEAVNYWTDEGQDFLDEIKSTYYWDVDKYLNIYVVNNSESSGVASFPYQTEILLNSKKWFDGIMVRHYNLGNTGTASNNLLPHILSHEVGHYLDLLHTWGSKSHPESSELDWELDCEYESENCPDFYCNSDDLVEDTPNTDYKGSGCIYEMESCGTPDNITNIMAYGCQLMFTKGQVERMHKALNSSIANRNNLWSNENLNYTLNCTGTPATQNCQQIDSSIITHFEVLQYNSAIIFAKTENVITKIRYKINNENWIELPETNLNYFFIRNIEKCTQYELQISEKCGDVFSPWSSSRIFYTSGEDIPKASIEEFYTTIEKQNETFLNANDGSITINTANGIAPYTFNWSTGDTTSTLNNLSAGEYQVTVSDAFGCSVSNTILLTSGTCNSLEINVLAINQTYFNEDNGSILIEVENGIKPYNIEWNTGDSLLQLNNLSPGEYSFSIEDAFGCTKSDTVLISPVVCDSFLVTIDYDLENFVGVNDATLNIVTVNGLEPIQYYWSTGDTTASISNLIKGDYIYTVADAKGCKITDTLSIGTTYCEDLTVDILTTNLTENNATDATARAIVTGGVIPYSFNWSTGDTTDVIENLQPDVYWVEVYDSIGCYAYQTITINPFDCSGLNYEIEINNESYKNAQDGAVSIMVDSLNAPYNFNWSTGDTLPQVTGLEPGIYYFSLSDKNGCELNDSLIINEVKCDDFSANILIENATCGNFNDGSLQLLGFENAVEPVNYFWNKDSLLNENLLTGLPKGFYFFDAIDDVGCGFNAAYGITEDSRIFMETSITPESWEGSKDGSILVTLEGGVEPYTYNWSTSDSTNFVNNLAAGIYTLTVTDAEGCSTPTYNLSVETSVLCPETSIISNNENLSSNTYQAKNSIESNAVIGIGENITFKAAKVVTLNNDFEVPKGADFSIEIGACE